MLASRLVSPLTFFCRLWFKRRPVRRLGLHWRHLSASSSRNGNGACHAQHSATSSRLTSFAPLSPPLFHLLAPTTSLAHRLGLLQGYFYSGILIGPAIAPAIGGVMTEYVPNGYGWRAMQWVLFGMGAVVTTLCYFFFPETSHERGIDVIRADRRREEEEERKEGVVARGEKKGLLARLSRDVVWLNPITPLRLLLLPHILCIVSDLRCTRLRSLAELSLPCRACAQASSCSQPTRS